MRVAGMCRPMIVGGWVAGLALGLASVAAAEEAAVTTAPPAVVIEEPMYDGRPLSSWIQMLQDHQLDLGDRRKAAHQLSQLVSPSADKQTVLTLGQLLVHEDPFIAQVAAAALSKCEAHGAASIPALTKALDDPRQQVRASAAVALSRFDPPRALPTLMDLVADTQVEPHIRRNAMNGIRVAAQRGERVPNDLLTALLQDENANVRQGAMSICVQAPIDILPVLAQAINSPDAYVRQTATKQLVTFGAPAVPTLAKALASDDRQVRHSAINALEQLAGPHDTAIIPMLRDAMMGTDSYFWQQVPLTLARIGAPAIPALREALLSERRELQQWAMQALVTIGPAAAPVFKDALHDQQGMVRHDVAVALSQVEPAAAVPALQELVRQGSQQASYLARTRLDAIDPNATLQALLDALEAEDAGMRTRAAYTLVHRVRDHGYPPEMITAFTKLLDDPSLRPMSMATLRQAGPAAAPAASRLMELLPTEWRAGEVLLAIGAPAVPALLLAAEQEPGIPPGASPMEPPLEGSMSDHWDGAFGKIIVSMKFAAVPPLAADLASVSATRRRTVADLLLLTFPLQHQLWARPINAAQRATLTPETIAAIPALIQALHDTDPHVRDRMETILERLATLHAEAFFDAVPVSVFLKMLQHEAVSVQRVALDILLAADPTALQAHVPAIERKMQSKDADVRASARTLLRRLQPLPADALIDLQTTKE